jgi:hypothetical protein
VVGLGEVSRVAREGEKVMKCKVFKKDKICNSEKAKTEYQVKGKIKKGGVFQRARKQREIRG